MKSITIHHIDDDIAKKLDELALERKMSLNKTIKYLLRKALGLDSITQENRKKELSKFLGVWNKEEHELFEKATREFENINETDWK